MGQQQNPNQLDTRVEPKRAMEAKCDDFIGQKLRDRRRIPAGSSWGRHAASVRPEPGSNSPKNYFSKNRLALNYLFKRNLKVNSFS